MVTKKEHKKGWTDIRINKITLKRLRIIKAQEDFRSFDEMINQILDDYESKILNFDKE